MRRSARGNVDGARGIYLLIHFEFGPSRTAEGETSPRARRTCYGRSSDDDKKTVSLFFFFYLFKLFLFRRLLEKNQEGIPFVVAGGGGREYDDGAIHVTRRERCSKARVERK